MGVFRTPIFQVLPIPRLFRESIRLLSVPFRHGSCPNARGGKVDIHGFLPRIGIRYHRTSLPSPILNIYLAPSKTKPNHKGA